MVLEEIYDTDGNLKRCDCTLRTIVNEDGTKQVQ